MKIVKKISFILFAILNLVNLHFKLRFLGNILDNLRMNLLRFAGSKIGKNSCVHPNVMILKPENLIMGDSSNIGSNSEIFNYSKLYIGNNVDIGTQFYINTNNHKTNDKKKPLAYQGGVSKEIKIHSDVWIGARVTILSGVLINERVVIGAGALITKNLKSGYVYGGVPAKIIKKIS
jgi:maltose O-acetyltransferase